jgi:chorismate synthase
VIENLRKPKSYPQDAFVGRFPSEQRQHQLKDLLVDAKKSGKSYGGTATIWVDACPAGLGQPVFRKLKADLAAALMSVGATSAVSIGDGMHAARDEGTQFHSTHSSAQYGGIRGGISTGESLLIQVHFKPTSSIGGVALKGRHDPCIVPRAIPVLEAMTHLVLLDHILWAKNDYVP